MRMFVSPGHQMLKMATSAGILVSILLTLNLVKWQNNKLLLLLFFVTKKRMRKLSFCNSMVEVSHLQLSYLIIHEMYIIFL